MPRKASVFFNQTGDRCWTKAWFAGREKGEPAIEISRKLATEFVNGRVNLDDWLTRFYPKQMNSYRNALETTRRQLLGI